MELAYRIGEDRDLRLSCSEIESLRFLLYRVLEEPGAAPDTRELRENILKKIGGGYLNDKHGQNAQSGN